MTLQDQMYDEAIAKWTNFDATKTPPIATTAAIEDIDEDDIPVNDTLQQVPVEDAIVTSTSTASSAPSMDLAEMLMPPYLTSYQSDDHHQQHQHVPILSSSMSAKIERRKSLAADESAAVLSKPSPVMMPALDEDEEVEEEEELPVDPDTIPEPIMDEERDAYHIVIAVFGEEIVACVLSIKSKCRERGLLHIQRCVDAACQLATENNLHQLPNLFESTPQVDTDEDNSAAFYLVNATLMMVQEAIMDSREPIVTLAIHIWQQLNGKRIHQVRWYLTFCFYRILSCRKSDLPNGMDPSCLLLSFEAHRRQQCLHSL